ncbi:MULTISPECIES: hypothetical protein [Aeromicrobium]|uniref:hypothetical protein n=1 Tax=Aeromicrobium TaxID=2040 RepID=UPI00188E08D9|nr:MULTISPECIES: hypothetical protein [Aeromicrobium]
MLKKVLLLLVVGFVVYQLVNSPASAADTVNDAYDWIRDALDRLDTFVRELSA